MSIDFGKPDFCLMKTIAQNSFAATEKLISAFVLATRIIQSVLYLYPKFKVLISSGTVQAGSCQIRSELPKTGFLMSRLTFIPLHCTLYISLVIYSGTNYISSYFRLVNQQYLSRSCSTCNYSHHNQPLTPYRQ